MSRTVTVEDGDNAYTLTRNDDEGTAALQVKGKLTPRLAKDLIEDLTPLTGARKKAAKPRAAAPAKPEGGA
ncbi:MAG: hypothetical protein BroJett013_30380 [Alphaproteobacteria bacterium]|nr:MAG: hypothetical protein BroJett013_30380 [Alphaproteobacteria bacterium]